MVKNRLSMQETQDTEVRSLSQKDPPEKEMATHSNILSWGIPWTEEPIWNVFYILAHDLFWIMCYYVKYVPKG